MIDNLVITGSMGSGKSTVLKLFEQQGFEIIDADKMVASLYDNSHRYYHQFAQELDQWLGSSFVNDKCIDKIWLRNKLTQTPDGFQIILHKVTPYIMHDMKHLLATHANASKIIFEVPLLVEAGLQHYFSNILVITCDDNIRTQRIAQRNKNLDSEQIAYIMSQQISQNEKIKIAHYVLDNSGTENTLREKFQKIFQQITKENIKTLATNSFKK
jgi:dephospho-CoA kinase